MRAFDHGTVVRTAVLIGAYWFCDCRASVADDVAPRGRLLFLGIAYDEAPPRGHGPGHYDYAPENVARLLRNQAATLFARIDVVTIPGAAATRNRIVQAFRDLQREARPQDFVVVYWGTHGGVARNGWAANLRDGSQVFGGDIKTALSKVACPVLCVISTCGAGGFPQTGRDGVELPANVTALCACRGRQSTTNEMDRALCEALAGFGDHDANGVVTLRETIDYIPKRYNQLFRGVPPTEELLPVIQHSESAPLDQPLSRVDGSYAAVAREGQWYGVTVLERKEASARVRFLGFDATTANGGFSMPDADVVGESIDFPGGTSPIDVEWEGTWYPAVILNRSRRGLRIHYIGYPKTDDETVPRSRVRFPFADADRERR
jgi:hypothetical protein